VDVDREVQEPVAVELLHVGTVQHVVLHVQAAGATFLLEHQEDRFLAGLSCIRQFGLQVAGERIEKILVGVARLGAGGRDPETQEHQQ
jgi:hypothetical protein